MGHYGVYTTRLAQALAKHGHDVVVVTNRLHPERFLPMGERHWFDISEVDGTTAFEYIDQHGGKGARRAYFGNSWKVLKSALAVTKGQAWDVDLIYVMDTEFLMATIALKLHRPKVPVVMYISAANFGYREYAGPAWMKAYKVIQHEIFKRTLGREINGIHVLGEYQRYELGEQLDLPEGLPIVTVYDAPTAEPKIPKTEARKALGIDYSAPLFLYFGMIRRDKGVDDLIAALAHVKVDYRVMIAGFPFDYSADEITGWAEAHGVNARLLYQLTYVPEEWVATYFNAADALILPYRSNYTGGSGPLLKQAASYGIPVIATDVAEMGSLVRHHGFGILAAPDSPPSLAGAIDAFIDLPENDKTAMRGEAANLVETYGWPRAAEQLTSLFEAATAYKEKGAEWWSVKQ